MLTSVTTGTAVDGVDRSCLSREKHSVGRNEENIADGAHAARLRHSPGEL